MDNVIPLNAKCDNNELRSKIVALESKMKEMKEHIVHIEPKHYFANGLYAREIFIPKDTLLTGHIHKTEHLCVLSQGEVTVYTDDGMKRIKASTVVHSSPGTKRALFAHEDSVWINFHYNPTNEMDLEKIESYYVTDTFEKYYLSSKRTFNDVLLSTATSAEKMKEISDRSDDFDCAEISGVKIKESSIHGLGLFADKKFIAGDFIAVARRENKRTIAGKYSNHSADPNAYMVMNHRGDVELFADKDIDVGEEITTDYFFNFTNTRINTLREKIA